VPCCRLAAPYTLPWVKLCLLDFLADEAVRIGKAPPHVETQVCPVCSQAPPDPDDDGGYEDSDGNECPSPQPHEWVWARGPCGHWVHAVCLAQSLELLPPNEELGLNPESTGDVVKIAVEDVLRGAPSAIICPRCKDPMKECRILRI
jgi:hypothetical protein